MEYRFEATSPEGFVQMLASNYLPHGYWFFVQGFVPEGKDPRAIDEKLLTRYRVRMSRDERARRKRAGHANVHYLRWRRCFVLLATKGSHPFFEQEQARVRDARQTPVRFQGYSLSLARGNYLRKDVTTGSAERDAKLRVRVQVSRERYLAMRAYFLEAATHRRPELLARELWEVPFEPYAPVRKQMLELLRVVNQARGQAGFEKLSPRCLRYRRRIVKPFEPLPAGPSADAGQAACEGVASS